MSLAGNSDCGQSTSTMPLGEVDRISAIGLDPIPDSRRINGATTTTQ